MRKVDFIQGEYYHIFNRGVDKRQIFLDQYDLSRFFQSMTEFNTLNPIGSIYENSLRKKKFEKFGNQVSKSSWEEYVPNEKRKNFCQKDKILSQFTNWTEYKEFAENSLEEIKTRKELEELFIE